MPKGNLKANTKKVATKKTIKKVSAKSKAPSVKSTKKNNVKVVKKSKKVVHKEEVEVPGKRYFKCIMINEEGNAVATGRYSGKKPKQAASKACTRLYDAFNDDNRPSQIVFGIHECTRTNKRKKKYFYVGKRVKLDKPEEVVINKTDPKTGNKMVIRYNYNNDVRKLTDTVNCKEYTLLLNYDVKEKCTTPKEVEEVEEVKEVKETPKKVVAKKNTAKKTAKTNKKKVLVKKSNKNVKSTKKVNKKVAKK